MNLFYVTVIMPYGRGEDFLLAEVEELINQHVQVSIVPRSYAKWFYHSTDDSITSLAIRTPLLSLAVMRDSLFEFLCRPLKTLGALQLLLCSKNVKELILNAAVFPKGLWLSRLARRRKADHIHVHWASTTATMVMVASRVAGIPWSVTAHRGDIAGNNLLQKKFEEASFVRFISASGLALARSLGVSLAEVRHHVIHMGVKLPVQVPEKHGGAGRPVILCPASFFPVKGHTYLLKAAALLKQQQVDFVLQFAGEGHLQQDIEHEIDQLGILDHVELLGHVAHNDLMTLYSGGQVDLVVLPSVDLGEGLHEGIPVSLIEAMGFGIPVISTTTGGIPELLHDGAGILVPPKDPDAIAEALIQLLVDPSLRYSLGCSGRERVLERFSIDKVVEQLLKLIHGTISDEAKRK